MGEFRIYQTFEVKDSTGISKLVCILALEKLAASSSFLSTISIFEIGVYFSLRAVRVMEETAILEVLGDACSVHSAHGPQHLGTLVGAA